MSVLKKVFLPDIILAIILYCTVIIYQGYQYGQSDQSQILPVLYAQDHPGAYENDHYVQAYLNGGINERTIFHALFRHMGYGNAWMVFFWHAAFSVLLFLAWISIATLFIKNKALQWLAIALIFTIGFHTSTGSNELYYNQFIPSLVAKALASWGLYYWLKEKYNGWVLLLLLSTIMQPLVGLQLFILTCLSIFIERFLIHNLKPLPWKQILVYILLAAPWIYLLAVNNGGQEDTAAFIDIMEFRLSHHFFGTSFGLKHLFLGLIFFTIVILYYKKRLRWMFVITAIGCIVYEIGVEVFRSPLVIYTQWWKTTIWVEAFAFIAMVSLMEKRFNLHLPVQKYLYAIPLLFLLLTGIYRFSGIRGERVMMDPLSKNYSDDADISRKANQLTPDNSVFIIPPELSAFRWYSKRSSFVDYKALFHQEDFLLEWYSRIKSIYEYDLAQKNSGISITERSKEIFGNPDPERIEKWKSLGITHYVGYTSGNASPKPIAQNETYSIYAIQ